MPQAATRFILPHVLARLSGLELLARAVVEGFIAGLHRSPYKGFSVDFMQYRPYVPGDDLRRVDWKVYARTDRFLVKEFEGETNTRVHLVLDASRSMGYQSHDVSKLEYACYLVASIAYLAIRQRDAAGLVLFDEDILQNVSPRSSKGHLHTLLKQLENVSVGAATSFDKPLHAIADQQQRRGFIVIVSDLLSNADQLIDALRHFRFSGHEVLICHVLDPQEVTFDFEDVMQIKDLETGTKLLIEGSSARALYQKNFQQFQHRIQRACGLLGIDYTLLTTDRPLDGALFQYLSARSRRRK